MPYQHLRNHRTPDGAWKSRYIFGGPHILAENICQFFGLDPTLWHHAPIGTMLAATPIERAIVLRAYPWNTSDAERESMEQWIREPLFLALSRVPDSKLLVL